MSNNPALIQASLEAQGLLAAMLVCPSLRNFSEDQQVQIQEVLQGLRDARAMPACPTPWEWFTMEHPDLAKVKETGQRILVFVPMKLVPQSASSSRKQLKQPKLAFAHWATQVAVPSAGVTPGHQAVALVQEHGGYWAADRRGIKPIRGLPSLWAYLPQIDCLS